MNRLKKLRQQPDNRICADCGAPDPKWASTSIGVFLCIKCSGVHRSLGVHISKVVSVTLDDWSDEQVDLMEAIGGNASANSVYEACMPSDAEVRGSGILETKLANEITTHLSCKDYYLTSR